MAKLKKKKAKEKINFKYNLSVYYGFLKKYKRQMLFVFLLVLFIESRNVIDKFLFKVIIDKGTEFTSGSLLAGAFIKVLLVVAIIFIVVISSSFAFRWLYIHITNRLEGDLILDLKRKFFNHLISLDHSFHVSHKTGSLISRLMRGASAMERITDVIVFNVAPLILELILVSLSLIYFSWIPALVVFLTIIVFIFYSLFIQKFQEESNLIANKTEDIEKANISDIFTNIDSIKYFGKENIIKKKFAKLSDNTKKAVLKNWQYFRWLDSGQSLILGVGTFFLVYFPLVKFLHGQFTLGTLAFIYTVFGGLVGSLFGFVYGIRNFYRAMADFQDLFEYGKIKVEIKDKPNAKELKIKEGEIEFKNIYFNYDKRKIFSNFNLKIPKNKKIALVGHSGCGKTTLVKLLYRFYDVNAGSIMIDSRDIREFKQESLREEMAIVPQECVLFDDTIFNNVAFSNQKASRDEVMKAMKFAQLDRIIEDFPKKEKTVVGERGVRLSGGEKQRVSIARAILANKKVLVLDEATSSLDSETEYEIQQELQELMQGRTSIIIAHRLSTIMKADRIIVMKKGKIVQHGTHAQLIKQEGEYRKLWNLQKGGYIK